MEMEDIKGKWKRGKMRMISWFINEGLADEEKRILLERTFCSFTSTGELEVSTVYR